MLEQPWLNKSGPQTGWFFKIKQKYEDFEKPHFFFLYKYFLSKLVINKYMCLEQLQIT